MHPRHQLCVTSLDSVSGGVSGRVGFGGNETTRGGTRPNNDGSGGGSNGGVSARRSEPAFIHFDTARLGGRYNAYERVDERWTDTNTLDMVFDQMQLLVIPEGILALSAFQQNYFGAAASSISCSDYHASGSTNLCTRIAFKPWTHSRSSHATEQHQVSPHQQQQPLLEQHGSGSMQPYIGGVTPRATNASEIALNLAFKNVTVLLPLTLHLRLGPRGELQSPATESVRVMFDSLALEMRYLHERFIDLSFTISPTTITIPSDKTRKRGRFRPERARWDDLVFLADEQAGEEDVSTLEGYLYSFYLLIIFDAFGIAMRFFHVFPLS
jgi:hypothetical protein